MTIQWPKDKDQNDIYGLQNTMHKTGDRATRTTQ